MEEAEESNSELGNWRNISPVRLQRRARGREAAGIESEEIID